MRAARFPVLSFAISLTALVGGPPLFGASFFYHTEFLGQVAALEQEAVDLHVSHREWLLAEGGDTRREEDFLYANLCILRTSARTVADQMRKGVSPLLLEGQVRGMLNRFVWMEQTDRVATLNDVQTGELSHFRNTLFTFWSDYQGVLQEARPKPEPSSLHGVVGHEADDRRTSRLTQARRDLLSLFSGRFRRR